MNSTVVQNVVTYDTIVDFANPDLKLFPGMTAYVSIPVATVANVVKVPNSALRYKPDLSAEEIRAIYQRYGIPEGGGARAQERKEETSAAAPAAQPRNGSALHKTGARSDSVNVSTGEIQGPRYDTQVVWKLLPNKLLEPVRIRTGITDHTFTEIVQQLNGELKPGDELVTGVAQGRAPSPRPGGPGMPRGR
jgi:HlyD family secretion protein